MRLSDRSGPEGCLRKRDDRAHALFGILHKPTTEWLWSE